MAKIINLVFLTVRVLVAHSVAGFLSEDLTSGSDGDVVEHVLLVVAEAGGLHSADSEVVSELVDDEDGEDFSIDVVGDDEEGTGGLLGVLEHLDEVLQVGVLELVLHDEDDGLIELAGLLLVVGHEVGGSVTSVESQTFDVLDFVVDGLAVLHVDGSVGAHLVHDGGDQVSDFLVVVGGDGGNAGEFFLVGNLDADLGQVLLDLLDGQHDSSSHVHGVHSS